MQKKNFSKGKDLLGPSDVEEASGSQVAAAHTSLAALATRGCVETEEARCDCDILRAQEGMRAGASVFPKHIKILPPCF